MLDRLDSSFMRGFVIANVRPAFDARVIETVGLVCLAVEEDSIF